MSSRDLGKHGSSDSLKPHAAAAPESLLEMRTPRPHPHLLTLNLNVDKILDDSY